MERFNTEPTLTSSETANLLAVHPSTVKRWCNEGDLPFDTTSGGHRRIQLEDAVSFARARGIDTVLSPFHPYEPHVWEALRDIREEGAYKRLHTLAMGWIVRGRIRALAGLYRAVARDESVPLSGFIDGAIRGLMAQVGKAWSEGKLRVAEEHLVSQALIEVLLGVSADVRGTVMTRSGAPVAVVGTLEGHMHHLGALCIRVLLERRGWEVSYLGPDVPIEDFAAIQVCQEASLICVSISPPAAGGDIARAVRVLGDRYNQVRPYTLALGGQFSEIDENLLTGPFDAVGTFRSATDFEAALRDGFASTGASVA